MRKSNLVSYFFHIDSKSIGNNFSYILQIQKDDDIAGYKGQDENLQLTQGRMTRQKTIPLRPLRDYVRYKTNVADINLEDSIACYIM